jgi:hypothetical protein
VPSRTARGADPEAAAWARAHGASYEVAALIEMVKKRPVQVGFTVTVYARLPLEATPGPERRAAAWEIQGRLRGMLESLAPPAGSAARMEIEGPRSAVFLTPREGMEPEVAVSARVYHGGDYFAEVALAEEVLVHRAARRLAALGLRERQPARG